MIGLLLMLVGTGAMEIRNILIKSKRNEFALEQLSALSVGFACIAMGVSAIIGMINGSFVGTLATASLPFIAVRLVLEAVQIVLVVKALKVCDRSAYSMLRVLTIPLLVTVDLLLGYEIGRLTLLGMGIVCVAFLVELFAYDQINRKGRQYAIATAVNAVITMSIYKYTLTHFGNGVEVEQGVVLGGVFLFLVVKYYIDHKQHPFANMSPGYILSVGGSVGISMLLISYSFLYLVASAAATLKRAFAMLYAVIAGVVLFHEKHFRHKIIMTLVIICGISLMMFA